MGCSQRDGALQLAAPGSCRFRRTPTVSYGGRDSPAFLPRKDQCASNWQQLFSAVWSPNLEPRALSEAWFVVRLKAKRQSQTKLFKWTFSFSGLAVHTERETEPQRCFSAGFLRSCSVTQDGQDVQLPPCPVCFESGSTRWLGLPGDFPAVNLANTRVEFIVVRMGQLQSCTHFQVKFQSNSGVYFAGNNGEWIPVVC